MSTILICAYILRRYDWHINQWLALYLAAIIILWWWKVWTRSTLHPSLAKSSIDTHVILKSENPWNHHHDFHSEKIIIILWSLYKEESWLISSGWHSKVLISGLSHKWSSYWAIAYHTGWQENTAVYEIRKRIKMDFAQGSNQTNDLGFLMGSHLQKLSNCEQAVFLRWWFHAP